MYIFTFFKIILTPAHDSASRTRRKVGQSNVKSPVVLQVGVS